VSLAAHFIHRCTVRRDSAQGENPYGGPSEPALYDVASDVPCRLVEKHDRVVFGLQQSERAQSMVVSAFVLLVGPDVDLEERDTVVIEGDAYRVSTVQERNTRAGHHKSARLERVS